MTDLFTILARGPWPRSSVIVTWDQREPAIREELVERTWQKALEDARASGRVLFPGPVAGLSSFTASTEELRLQLHATDYRAFVGTNLSRDYLATGAPRADALGVSVFVKTEGRALLHRRGAGCFEWPLAIDTPGGHVDPRVHAGASPFEAALDELESELGIHASEVASLSALGLARIADTEKPQLVVAARVTIDVDAIRARLPHARESFETHELLPIERHEMAALARSTTERVTPAGRVALTLACESDAFDRI